MAYTTIKKPSDYFNTKLYTGNGSDAHSITGVGFQPDFVWIKNRDGTWNHALFDSVRGATKKLESDTTDAEATASSFLQSFNSDGFTLGTSGTANASGEANASWNWLANGAGSANTDGSISSTVSANTTSGFSIVSYTGGGSAGATVGHGLGIKLGMILLKRRDGLASNWAVYHKSLGATKYLILNETDSSATSNTRWNDAEPTSTVFTLGSSGDVSGSGEDFIAYCFAEKQGYSKFGSYTGNGNADGTFVYTGFKPAFVMSKRSDAIDGWRMMDTTRSSYNVAQHRLLADAYAAEVVGTAQGKDFLSNGFKIRNTDSGYNASGGIYIYMAFAEQPLVGDNPATAR
jgi:hypothetical protein